jgi:threonine/homoserine/homoserine lactone efflux protein
MVDPGSLLIFTLAGIGLNVTPGPDMVYVATRTVGQG